MDCSICCEPSTAHRRKIIECGACKQGACLRCCQTYILANETDTKCMHCGEAWDPLFMCEQFPKSWIAKEYGEHRGTVLINRDKPRKPEIYGRIIEEKRGRQETDFTRVIGMFVRDIMDLDNVFGTLIGTEQQKKEARKNLKKDYYRYRHEKPFYWKRDIREVPEMIVNKYKKILEEEADWDLIVGNHLELFQLFSKLVFIDLTESPELVLLPRWRIATTGRFRILVNLDNRKEKVEERVSFTYPCPLGDCEGFMDSHGNCPSCKKKICMKCETEEGENHECDPSLVETVHMLRRTSRPCPKCSVPIHKTDGCDQMWCTQCHTTFSYRTGIIHEGRTHNPEYYRWLRENNNGVVPREPGDNPNAPHPQAPGPRDPCRDTTPFGLMTRLATTRGLPKTKGRDAAEGIMRLAMEHEDNIRMGTGNRFRAAGWGVVKNTKWYPRGVALAERDLQTKRDECIRKVLEKTLDDNEWKNILKNEEKNFFRQTFTSDVVETLFLVAREMVDEFIRVKDDKVFLEHLESLINYTNNRLKSFKNTFKGCMPYVVPNTRNERYFRYEFKHEF